MELTVRANWDVQASVWVAESDDVPGLITEADDLEALMSKLRVMIPELLEANGALPPNVDELPFSLIVLDRTHRLAASWLITRLP
jgi:predicted RNase H-like HicB family nuclease